MDLQQVETKLAKMDVALHMKDADVERWQEKWNTLDGKWKQVTVDKSALEREVERLKKFGGEQHQLEVKKAMDRYAL